MNDEASTSDAERAAVSTDPRRMPWILFVALVNEVGMERVPAALGALGANCAVLSPAGFYCTTTRRVSRHFPLPQHRGIWLGTMFVRSRLEAAVHECAADLIVPLDNVAALLLRMLARSGSVSNRLRALLQTSLGSTDGYDAACTRAGLMRIAAALGVRVPRYCIADDEAAALAVAESWGYPVVLKAEHTCGGLGVVIVSSPAQLRAALGVMVRGATFLKRCRAVARHWIWSRAGMGRTAALPPLLQALVPGVPAMRTISAWRGRVLDGVSFIATRVHPAPTGPSSAVRQIVHEEMAETARRIVAALGCSGFVSFDFMLEGEHGPAHLIEMNPRPIGTTHLGRMFGHDPCAALLAQLRGDVLRPMSARIAPDREIALFPKELERDPNNIERLRDTAILHDVPYDEPAVIAAYMRRLSGIHPHAATEIGRRIADMTGHVSVPATGRGSPTVGARHADMVPAGPPLL